MPAKTKPINPKNMREMAEKVLDYLASKELWPDFIHLYVDGSVWTSTGRSDMRKTTAKGTEYFEDQADVEQAIEYFNVETITMKFEGAIIHHLFDDPSSTIEDDLNVIFGEYGLYLERGFSWSLAAYEI